MKNTNNNRDNSLVQKKESKGTMLETRAKNEAAKGKNTVPSKRRVGPLNSEMKVGKEIVLEHQSHVNEPKLVTPGQDSTALG